MLFIVARGTPQRFEALQQEFRGRDDVRVIYDRRFQDRRRAPAAYDVERRVGERRRRPYVDADVTSRGWSIVETETVTD